MRGVTALVAALALAAGAAAQTADEVAPFKCNLFQCQDAVYTTLLFYDGSCSPFIEGACVTPGFTNDIVPGLTMAGIDSYNAALNEAAGFNADMTPGGAEGEPDEWYYTWVFTDRICLLPEAVPLPGGDCEYTFGPDALRLVDVRLALPAGTELAGIACSDEEPGHIPGGASALELMPGYTEQCHHWWDAFFSSPLGTYGWQMEGLTVRPGDGVSLVGEVVPIPEPAGIVLGLLAPLGLVLLGRRSR